MGRDRIIKSLISALLLNIFCLIALYFTKGKIWHLISLVTACLGLTLVLVLHLEAADKRNARNPTADNIKFDTLSFGFYALLCNISSRLNKQLSRSKADLEHISRLLHDASSKLSQSFTSLEAQIKVQHKLILYLTNQSMKADDAYVAIDLESFINEAAEIMAYFVDIIVDSSKYSMQLVEKIEDISTNMGVILRDVSRIDSITNQAEKLAINANKKTSNEEESRRHFLFVTNEIRKLALNLSYSSKRINEHVQKVPRVLQEAEASTRNLASKDMDFAVKAREDMTDAKAKIKALNRKMLESIRRISHINSEIQSNVNSVITALQFEDLAMQMMARIMNRFEKMEIMLNSVNSLKVDIEMWSRFSDSERNRYLDQLSKIKTETEIGLSFLEDRDLGLKSQQDMNAGSIEIFQESTDIYQGKS